MLLKGPLFNNFLKEYSILLEIISFELEFLDPTSLECQIKVLDQNRNEYYIPIELEDYEKLAQALYENKKLDLSHYDYCIYKAE